MLAPISLDPHDSGGKAYLETLLRRRQKLQNNLLLHSRKNSQNSCSSMINYNKLACFISSDNLIALLLLMKSCVKIYELINLLYHLGQILKNVNPVHKQTPRSDCTIPIFLFTTRATVLDRKAALSLICMKDPVSEGDGLVSLVSSRVTLYDHYCSLTPSQTPKNDNHGHKY